MLDSRSDAHPTDSLPDTPSLASAPRPSSASRLPPIKQVNHGTKRVIPYNCALCKEVQSRLDRSIISIVTTSHARPESL